MSRFIHALSTRVGARSASRRLTWGAVALVFLVVVALVVIALMGSTPPVQGGNRFEPAPPSLTSRLTQIKASVYDAVGVSSSVASVTAPQATSVRWPVTVTNKQGNQVPVVFYYGAEFCPYCAAERWALISALSRFGSLSHLGLTTSSATDFYPSTASFSFLRTTMTTEHVDFQAVERYSNIPDPKRGSYTTLEKPTAEQTAWLTRYDTGPQGLQLPFVLIGNRFVLTGSQFSPSILQGLTRDQIAAGLTDPANPVTKAIVSASNYLAAALCVVSGLPPSAVRGAAGVRSALSAMKQ